MTLTREGQHITVSINGESETMSIGDWSRIISKPSKIERFTFALPPDFQHQLQQLQ
jgi:hypothetical protein